jgi:uncharacterized protein YyaL (SSP411 family)
MMVAALAEAGSALGREDWVDAAEDAAHFLLEHLRREDGRWHRSWQAEVGARHLAYAVDHAALIDAFTRLAEATGEARWIEAARSTAADLLTLFWDDDHGGVFTTGTDGEQLVTRPKDLLDNATPSANSLAANALLRLGTLVGDDALIDRATAIVALLAEPAGRHPMAFGNLLGALGLAADGLTEVVVAGDRADLVTAVQQAYRPNVVLAWGERYPSPLWDGRDDDRAYVCRNYACQLPASDVETLEAQLRAG